ncbi:MAG TPA: hypothetical protein VI300_11230 [Solirubrobacter sp.]
MNGTLTIEGRPLGGQDVLALAGGRLVATAVTDDRGAFSLQGTGDAALTVLAKVRGGSTYGLVGRIGGDGEAAVLALPAPFALDIHVEGEQLPERLDLALDPVHLDGVDDALLALANLRPDGLMDAHFGCRVIDLEGTELKLQPGTWRLTASWEDPDHFDAPTYSGETLVVVEGDERVTLHVALTG